MKQNIQNFMEVGQEPITNSLGQIEHQTVYTKNGGVIDLDDKQSMVVETNGLAVIPEDEEKLKQYIKEAISVQNFIETFNVNAHETLLKLLALQDNQHPLKKGGVGVAYRTDALIMHCKMEFTSQENIVFDAILGTMSTFPEDNYYKIEPSVFLPYSKHKDKNYLYTIFRQGVEKLRHRHLEFENLGIDGDDDISIPWFNVLKYHKGKNSSSTAYIEFVPSDFFKVLALSSQLVHGAYGALEVTMQLRGKYTIALYWFLENKKQYREYKGATSGIFNMSIEDFKHQFSIPNSYSVTDLRRKVLDPAKELNTVLECDFKFDYEIVKQNGVYAGIKFTIKTKKAIENKDIIDNDTKEREQNGELSIEQIKMFLMASNVLLKPKEVERVFKKALEYQRTPMFMMQTIVAFKQRIDNQALEPVDDYTSYLCKMIEMDLSVPSKKRNVSQHDIEERDIDFDDLEKKLLSN